MPSPCKDASVSSSDGQLKSGQPRTGAIVKQAFRRLNASWCSPVHWKACLFWFGPASGSLFFLFLLLFDGLLDLAAGANI